ncbi:MAG: hypothetical protein M1819_000639 [Sarea resinae]|nr:MAG: hypothetical protein M1819_000639 [Sarea resinae]
MSDTHDGIDGLDSNIPRAAQACNACRRQKRRCSKEMPCCSLCLRMGRPCDYSDSSPTPTADDFHFLWKKVQNLEDRLEGRRPVSSSGSPTPISKSSSSPTGEALFGSALTNGWRATPSFPPLFFLDSEEFAHGNYSVQKPHMHLPVEILDILGDTAEIQAMVATYFATVHTWLPIVSKKRFCQLLMNPPSSCGVDLSLLLLCMKLITQEPPKTIEATQSPLYTTAKQFFTLVEWSGIFSLQLVQSALLLAAYEIGHAIYPAAYLSVGHCARLGYALGLHSRKASPQMLPRPSTWTEMEERRRIWWAVIMLDRYVNVGNSNHPLASEDPSRDDYLPVDDTMWDQGEMTANEPLFVSSSTNLRAAPFARTCQASHLLGRVIRHLNDRTVNRSILLAEATQLERTVRALSLLLSDEFQEHHTAVSTPMAICYSALMAIYDAYACHEANDVENTPEEIGMQGNAIGGLKTMTKEIMILARHLRETLAADGTAWVSPLVTDCLYQAAANYAWLVRETHNSENAEALNEIKATLAVIDRRWRVAGEYIKILEANEFTYAVNVQ